MRLINTRSPSESATFSHAVQVGMAPSNGLWIPVDIPSFTDIPQLLAMDFVARSQEIVWRFLGEEFQRKALDEAVEKTLSFPIPLVQVSKNTFALELFHGPTLAFKDVGARFMAQMLGLISQQEGTAKKSGSAKLFCGGLGGHGPRFSENIESDTIKRGQAVPPDSIGKRTILTATSGDTGSAVAHAFYGLENIRAVVLYPDQRISPLQERQLATLGGNIHAYAVSGSFDDCQTMVKACFEDKELCAQLNLTSANSINIARLLGQVIYYFEALSQAQRLTGCANPVIAVPSGNFGNLTAGLLAWRTGLPVKRFVIATNANRTVPDFLDTGHYRPRPSVATLSNAMDVGAPSNWERVTALLPDLESLRSLLRWGSLDDPETRQAIRELDAMGHLYDPHGAVAWKILQGKLEPDETGIFLATAHPAKFRESMEEILGRPMELPPALASLMNQSLTSRPLSATLEALRLELLSQGEKP